MHDAESTEQEKIAEDLEVEFTDLDLPGSTSSSKSLLLAFALFNWQRSLKRLRYRRYWRRVSTLSILLMLVVLFRLSNGLSSPLVKSFSRAFFPASQASSSLAALPEPENITCMKDVAWSPDSALIAVLGYHKHCSEDNSPPELLNLYDAHSHKLIAQLHPDAAIVHVLTSSVSFPQRQPLVINYMHVIWSPDGHRIACTFNTRSLQPPVNGAVLMDSEGGHAQVLLQSQYTSASFYAEWDLARSQSIPFTSVQSNSSFMPLPLALAYHWGSNGTLVPETLLTHTRGSAIPQLAPIGNPDGDPSFTIWQPGAVYVTVAADSSHLFFWSASFAAWSPDGRYLVDGIVPFGLLWLPAGQLFPGSQEFAFAKENHVPLLPVRDRALLQVVETATALAWSPNGRVLAVLSSGKSVDLFDCTDGRKLASRVLESKNMTAQAGASMLRWSPDGSHLLFSGTLWALI
jgi:hypothetical protein